MATYSTVDPQPGDLSCSGVFEEAGTHNGKAYYSNGSMLMFYDGGGWRMYATLNDSALDYPYWNASQQATPGLIWSVHYDTSEPPVPYGTPPAPLFYAAEFSLDLSADPTTITEGESSTITWATVGAVNVVDSNFEAAGLNGNKSVSPVETTEYYMTVDDGSTHEITKYVTITVNPVVLTTYPTAYSGYSQVNGNGPGGDYEKIRPGRATLGGKDCVVLLRRTMF